MKKGTPQYKCSFYKNMNHSEFSNTENSEFFMPKKNIYNGLRSRPSTHMPTLLLLRGYAFSQNYLLPLPYFSKLKTPDYAPFNAFIFN
jgi:hypothetical protein